MAEYIERKAAIESIMSEPPDAHYPHWYADKIKAIPATDVAPVRHGRWLFINAGQCTSVWCCSECGRSVAITCDEELRQRKLEKEYPFCHCGAKMDLEGPNETE